MKVTQEKQILLRFPNMNLCLGPIHDEVGVKKSIVFAPRIRNYKVKEFILGIRSKQNNVEELWYAHDSYD